MTFIYIWTNGIAPLDLELVDAVQPQGEESEAGEQDQHLDWPKDHTELGVVDLLGPLPNLPLLLLSARLQVSKTKKTESSFRTMF